MTSSAAPTPYPRFPVLIIDDEQEALRGCEFMLHAGGITHTLACQDSRRALALLEERGAGVVLLDLSMPHISGEKLLQDIAHTRPDVPVIIITGANDVETAVRCMQANAFDYMVKPVERNRMVSGVRRAIELRALRDEYEAFRARVLSDHLDHPEAFAAIVTNNGPMIALFRYIETIAKTDQPVLITGETGVGKELVARAVHAISGRTGQFIDVNIAGLDDNVFSDTLFGHAKGAFTGADAVRRGLVEQAGGGTLLLDEIGDLSHASQVKLLRLLQEGRYLPLGSDVSKRAHARIVAVTNRDPGALQQEGCMRPDLYYRLCTHHVHVPPLRERLDDIPLLLDHFLACAAEELDRPKPTPPPELATLLQNYRFPGNVRELESMVFDAVSKHKARMLSMETFKRHTALTEGPVAETGRPSEPAPGAVQFPEQLPTVQAVMDQLVLEAMRRANNNQSLAARFLGISRPTLIRRLKQLGALD